MQRLNKRNTLIFGVLAGLVVAGVVSAQIYSSQEVDKQEFEEIEEYHSTPEPTEEPTPSPSPEPTEIPVSQIKTSVSKPVSNTSPEVKGAVISVPQMVESAFRSVYGRNPSGSESEFWKARVRSNSWSQAALRAAIVEDKAGESKSNKESSQVTPIPFRPSYNSSYTPKTSNPTSYNITVPDTSNDSGYSDAYWQFLIDEAQRESEEIDAYLDEQSRIAEERRIRCQPIQDELAAKQAEIDGLRDSIKQRTAGTLTTEAQRQAIYNKEVLILYDEYDEINHRLRECEGR